MSWVLCIKCHKLDKSENGHVGTSTKMLCEDCCVTAPHAKLCRNCCPTKHGTSVDFNQDNDNWIMGFRLATNDITSGKEFGFSLPNTLDRDINEGYEKGFGE